ncbi:MAG: DUF58 domain-containing protein [Deltaproteobacteria bacterium]|nr:DUF58 domain-containing protein [Deltaproteobacteria bacterium]
MRALLDRLLLRLAPWRRRRLRSTATGRVVIALTLAVGFAAMNTGNNLLFFGWGLLLSAIVISGILSEATLRAVRLWPLPSGEARAHQPARLPVVLENARRLPAFAVELRADVTGPSGSKLPGAGAFELRMAPRSKKTVDACFVPKRRGRHRIDAVRAATGFPFGFFEKEKLAALESPVELVVLPGRVDVGDAAHELLARLGDAPARRAGPGDELFGLRPFRAGDDPRRLAWRRSAKTGRLVVRETEAQRSRDLILDVVLASDGDPDATDHALDVAASLAEDLLAAGHAVGLRAPGCALAPSGGPRQRGALLHALALIDARAPRPELPARRAAVIAVVAERASIPAGAAAVVDAARVPRAA